MPQIVPSIETLKEKKLVGLHLRMSLANNKTPELWRTFMQRRKDVTKTMNTELISMQVYDAGYFDSFNPEKEFEKWATAEVRDFSSVPEGMGTFVLKSGQYAVFHYKGLNTDHTIYQYIFSSWLPSSKYILDHSPHFEILGDKYRNGDPASEEEIWIPVRLKEDLP